MGSEINSDRSGQSQDLRDLQDSYRKRRQAVEEEGQSELQKTRKDNQEKIKAEAASGDAAVNHVRNNSKERLEQIKTDTDQKLTYERKSLAKGLQTEREHSREQLDGIDDGVKAKSEQLSRQIQEQDKREAHLRQRESQATNAVSQEQAERRAKIVSQEQQEMSEFGKKVEHQKQELSTKSHEDIANLSEKSHKEMAQLQSQTKQAYAKQTEYSQEQLKAQREQQAKNLNTERQTFTKNETGLRDHAQQELKREQDNESQKFTTVKHENQVEIERAREGGVKNMEKTRSYYDKNIATIEKKGDAKVHEQNEIQEHRIRDMDQEHKEALVKAKAQHEDEMQSDANNFNQQATQNKDFYRQSLVEQRKEYDSAFKRNMKDFEDQVRNQHQLLNNSLAKEKREVIEDVGKYNSKNSDPFYRLAEPKAELHETDDHYIVQARVPEHEKDNVKVVVHENKVIVQGERRFEDQVQDPESKIATHSYQTYRQEIPLEHPVREKFMRKNYENGVLTVRIPKA